MAQRTNGAAKRQTVNGQIELLRQTADSDRKEFFKLLPKALTDRSPTVRNTAVLLVTEHRLREAAPLVELLLYDNDQDVRYYAVECIGILQTGRKSSPPGLRRLLRDASSLVRVQAVETLGLLEDQRALPNIVRLLSDKDRIVRSYAASVVGTLGGFAYLKNIRRGLIRQKDELARVGLFEASFLLGEPKVVPEMLMLLQSSDYHVRCAVANTLEVMPLRTPEVQLAIAALASANRKPCGVADKTTIIRVLKALRAKLRRIRPGRSKSALSTYRGIGTPRVGSGRKAINHWLRELRG